MEVTALCIRLLMNVLFLLCALHQEVDSVSLRVDPNRLQFFEYETLTLHCEGFSGSTGWKLVRQSKGEGLKCKSNSKVTSTGSSCTIINVYLDDSGEYWCEDGERKRSNSINITVTAGSVILESPALPVMEGKTVTLSCRNKTTSSNLTADFYKDGLLMGSSSTGEMIIHSVSKSDEGLYKCKISGAGESAESWLAVRGPKGTPSNPTSSTPTSSSSTPWVVVTVLLLVLLLVVGLLHLHRHWHRAVISCTAVLRYLSTIIHGSDSAEDQTVSTVEASAADADTPTYAVVRKKKKKDEDESLSGPVYYTLDLDETRQPAKPGASSVTARHGPSTGSNPPLTEEAFYSTIQPVAK